MKVRKLLQIADVHYPDAKTDSAMVDLKDKAAPGTVVQAVSTDRLQSVAREICRLCESDKSIYGILVCGDLTSRGEIEGYKSCLSYLCDVCGLADRHNWPVDHIHAVPGNHDVDRNRCMPDGSDVYAKFQPLAEAWAAMGLPILSVREARQTTLTRDGCSVAVFSLNSCIGCGEKRSLPPKVQDQLHELLRSYMAKTALADAFALVGEQLDTPAFHKDHLTAVTEQIDELNELTLPIVLAHHNILPQAVPRIDIYTEAINAGLVRSRLSHCKHPVVYCHGHIHSEMVEIVRDPSAERGPLISVSSSCFADGFNLLEVCFGQKGVPLGLTVVPYRIQEDGRVDREEQNSVRISLRTERQHGEACDERILRILPLISSTDFQRFREILDGVRRDFDKQIHERTLAEALLEAEWMGLVKILDRSANHKRWHIRRVGP